MTFFLPSFPDGLFADQADAAALAAFVVDESGDVGQLGFVAELVLIAADDPVVVHLALGDVLRAVLDAGVVGGVAAEGEAQFKVASLCLLARIRKVLPLAGFSAVVSP